MSNSTNRRYIYVLLIICKKKNNEFFILLQASKKEIIKVLYALWALKLKKRKKGNCPWFPVVYSFMCRFWILHSLNCIDLVTWSPVTIMTWACWCPINLQLSFNSTEVKLGASSVFLNVWNTPELIYIYYIDPWCILYNLTSYFYIKLAIYKHIFPCSLLSY